MCAQKVTLYGSSLLGGSVPAGQPLEIEGASQPGQVTKNGLVLYGSDGKTVSIPLGLVSNLLAKQFSTTGVTMFYWNLCCFPAAAGEEPAV